MAPRPKNPPPDRRQDILEAALRVFATKGYTAATNAEIAREAGVTAAALYYYFPSKQELFREVITQRRGALEPHLEHVTRALQGEPLEVVIPALTRTIFAFLSEEPTQMLLRIVLSEGPRDPEIAEAWQSYAVGPMAAMVFGHMQHQMAAGNVRPMDPRLLGVTLLGPIMFMLMVRDMLRLPMLADLDSETFLTELNHTMLYGLTAKRETE